MPLASGVKLGPYEILSPLGAGGMGEVYLARDTRLGRDVALKVLPEAFARDAERMARFEREAKVLASLNHPNIASIYGLEDSSGIRALVMELVEGPTLADRVKSGAIPLDEALPIAKQICEALEYAHVRGIVHRDLKPSNIKIGSTDAVKILDFGLAKALEGDPATTDISNSPTLSHLATRAGFLLGTAAYMSPEQAKGKSVDRRTDIWAFGCVLYEMLTGKMAFGGETITDTLAAVIKSEPDWSQLPSNMPPRIPELLVRCLKKDARQRLQAIGEARISIDEMISGTGQSASPSTRLEPAAPRWLRVLPWALTGMLTLALAASFLILPLAMREPPAPAIFSQIEPPENTNFVLTGISAGPPALSPDGHAFAFAAASSDGRRTLWVQDLDSPAAHSLDGTDDATSPFWSPDSRSLGFFARGKLFRVDASGGPVLALCDAAMGRGGAWGTDGTILIALLTGPILRVTASGGTPQPVTKLNEFSASHRWPQFLPDGRHFLFFDETRGPNSMVYVGSLDGSKPKALFMNDSDAVYAPPGYLLFVRQGTLMAQHFDAANLQLSGEASPLAGRNAVDSSLHRGSFTVSETGILAYASAGLSEARLLWFDRSGQQLAETGTTGVYGYPRISPDGSKLAIPIADSGVSIFDLIRGIGMRLTFTPELSKATTWSPDGKLIAFDLTRNGRVEIDRKAADGTGATTPMVADDADNIRPMWSADGRYLLYQRLAAQGHSQWEIWATPLSGERKGFPILQNPQFLEGEPELSPDGKWLAHDSNETGSIEVYLTPFLHGAGKWQVSANGGSCPHWRADGRELFYMSLENKIMSAEVSEQGSGVVIGDVRPLFQTDPAPAAPECMYDVNGDGKKFVVVTQSEKQRSRPLTLVTNWPALLKKQ